MNASIYVRFSGEMHNRVGIGRAQGVLYRTRVADITLQETISRMVSDWLEILKVSGVRELIENQNPICPAVD
jgi:hypothetical protein